MPKKPEHVDGPKSGGDAKPTKLEFKLRMTSPDSYTYANMIGVAFTPWDVRLHFANAFPSIPGDSEVRAASGIIMAPENAASLALLLTKQVQLYERQFGAIRNKQWREKYGKPDTLGEIDMEQGEEA